jgi:uncharacterized protein (UPF0548 family)
MSEPDADDTGALADLALTYREVGATGVALPDGYDHLARDVEIGRGEPAFRAAGEALMTWGMQRGAGLRVTASAPRAAVGVNVVVSARIGLVRVDAPCRVVHVVEQADRLGFTYGTLRGHPVSGEESFSVLLDDDRVRFVLIAFSKPANLLTRLAGPLGRTAQAMTADRYARALRRAAEQA